MRFDPGRGAERVLPPALPKPEWQGEDLTGKSILVWWEQGIGDQLTFLSVLPEAIHEFRRQCVVEDATHLLSRHLGKAEVDQVANLISELFGKNMPERQPAPEQSGSSTVIPLHPRGKHLH